jgi:hypothetical protein
MTYSLSGQRQALANKSGGNTESIISNSLVHRNRTYCSPPASLKQ